VAGDGRLVISGWPLAERAGVHCGLRVNVLLITADQFRGDFLGCAGHPTVRTPNLDALALAGASFPNAYSPVPVCVPARYSIMTGQVPIGFGVRGNSGRIPSDFVTLPSVFSAAGYATAAIGKMHFTPWTDPHGFETFTVSEEGRQAGQMGPDGPGDAYQHYLRQVGWGGYERAHGIGNNDVHTSASPLPLEHYHTVWAARETQRWIENHVRGDAAPDDRSGGSAGSSGSAGSAGSSSAGTGAGTGTGNSRSPANDSNSRNGSPNVRPFFAWCSFTKPHSPYDPPEPYDRLYDPRAFPPPIGDASDIAGLSPHYQQVRNIHLWETLGPEQIQRARAFYAGSCTLVDTMVGELRRTLETLGIADETVVLFTADHGDLLGDHGLFFKSCYYQGAWHVPFILHAPGRLEGRGTARRFVRTEDVFPTLLAAAGVPLPDNAQPVHGEDVTLAPDAGPETIFGSVLPSQRGIHSARTARWSYVVHARGDYEELYDLEADPGERHNLIPPDGSDPASGETANVRADLRSQLERWLAQVGDSSSLTQDGRLSVTPAERGWTPDPQIRTQLGLRPY
jgi:arylsulfatase